MGFRWSPAGLFFYSTKEATDITRKHIGRERHREGLSWRGRKRKCGRREDDGRNDVSHPDYRYGGLTEDEKPPTVHARGQDSCAATSWIAS